MDAPPGQLVTDRQAILETLERHHVEYVLIGGVAAPTRGYEDLARRATYEPAANTTLSIRVADDILRSKAPLGHRGRPWPNRTRTHRWSCRRSTRRMPLARPLGTPPL